MRGARDLDRLQARDPAGQVAGRAQREGGAAFLQSELTDPQVRSHAQELGAEPRVEGAIDPRDGEAGRQEGCGHGHGIEVLERDGEVLFLTLQAQREGRAAELPGELQGAGLDPAVGERDPGGPLQRQGLRIAFEHQGPERRVELLPVLGSAQLAAGDQPAVGAGGRELLQAQVETRQLPPKPQRVDPAAAELDVRRLEGQGARGRAQRTIEGRGELGPTPREGRGRELREVGRLHLEGRAFQPAIGEGVAAREGEPAARIPGLEALDLRPLAVEVDAHRDLPEGAAGDDHLAASQVQLADGSAQGADDPDRAPQAPRPGLGLEDPAEVGEVLEVRQQVQVEVGVGDRARRGEIQPAAPGHQLSAGDAQPGGLDLDRAPGDPRRELDGVRGQGARGAGRPTLSDEGGQIADLGLQPALRAGEQVQDPAIAPRLIEGQDPARERDAVSILNGLESRNAQGTAGQVDLGLDADEVAIRQGEAVEGQAQAGLPGQGIGGVDPEVAGQLEASGGPGVGVDRRPFGDARQVQIGDAQLGVDRPPLPLATHLDLAREDLQPGVPRRVPAVQLAQVEARALGPQELAQGEGLELDLAGAVEQRRLKGRLPAPQLGVFEGAASQGDLHPLSALGGGRLDVQLREPQAAVSGEAQVDLGGAQGDLGEVRRHSEGLLVASRLGRVGTPP